MPNDNAQPESAWIDRYFKAVLDKDFQKQEGSRPGNDTYQNIFRIARHFRGQHPELDKRIDALGDALRNGVDGQTVDKNIGDLAAALDRCAPGSKPRTNLLARAFTAAFQNVKLPQESTLAYQLLLKQIHDCSDPNQLTILMRDVAEILCTASYGSKSGSLFSELFEDIASISEYSDALDKIQTQVRFKGTQPPARDTVAAISRLFELNRQSEKSKAARQSDNLRRIILYLREIQALTQRAEDLHAMQAAARQERTSTLASYAKELKQLCEKTESIHEIRTLLDRQVAKLQVSNGDKAGDPQEIIGKTMANIKHKLIKLQKGIAKVRQSVKRNKLSLETDNTTGLPNRIAYKGKLEQELIERKNTAKPLSIMVIDVDKFTAVNNAFGQLLANQLLRRIGGALKSYVPSAYFLARYSSDSFVVILSNTNVTEALFAANELRKKINQSNFQFNNTKIPVTISCGISQYRKSESPEVLFERAEIALREAQQLGGNRCKTEQSNLLERTKVL